MPSAANKARPWYGLSAARSGRQLNRCWSERMRERKSHPPSPKPVREAGYIRKDELDDHLDIHLPVPTRTVSNEELVPIEQTSQQSAVEAELLNIAGSSARSLGIDRRSFLRSSCGM